MHLQPRVTAQSLPQHEELCVADATCGGCECVTVGDVRVSSCRFMGKHGRQTPLLSTTGATAHFML